MEEIMVNNSIQSYLKVILIYGLMFLFIRYPKPALELNYHGNFIFLGCLWFILMFTGNYLFYRLGVMVFLPWLSNFLHCLFWIAICLTWLYYSSRSRPLWEQFIYFAFTS